MDLYIEFMKAVATPVTLIVIAFIFRRGIATKDDLAASERRTGEKIEDLRKDLSADIAEVRKDLAAGLAEVRKDLAAELAETRKDLAAELAETRKDLAAELAEVRKDLAAIREILAFMRGQSTPPSRVLQLPRQERGESERDEA